jgi:hypothetical protein
MGLPVENTPNTMNTGKLLYEINGEIVNYIEIKLNGNLTNYVTTNFEGTAQEMEEMEELLVKL